MPVFLLYFALLAVAFFFLIVRPQRRQLSARRALIAALEVDDDIITAGGIYATVRAIDGDVLSIEVADGVVLTLARDAVARRREDAEDAQDAQDADMNPDDNHRAVDAVVDDVDSPDEDV